MRNIHLVLTLSGAAAFSMACSDAATGAASAPPETLKSISPLLAFAKGGDDPGKSYDAVKEKAVEACMKAKGWSYEPVIFDGAAAQESTDPAAMLAFRQQFGYGLLNHAGVDQKASGAVKFLRSYFEKLPAEQQVRFARDLGATGDEEGSAQPSGCRGQVAEALEEQFPLRDPAVLHDLSQGQLALERTEDFVAAAQLWVACMTERGFEYADIHGGHREVSDLYLKGSPSDADRARERAVGAADAQCALTTIWPVQSRLEKELLEEVLARHAHKASAAKGADRTGG